MWLPHQVRGHFIQMLLVLFKMSDAAWKIIHLRFSWRQNPVLSTTEPPNLNLNLIIRKLQFIMEEE